jgi:transposase-like protein
MKPEHLDSQPAYAMNNVSEHGCPLCAAFLIRVKRRTRDRLISLFVPLERYRCLDFSCNWEGNLRAERSSRSSGPLVDRLHATAKTRHAPGAVHPLHLTT